jgi:hypothetical protein
MVFANGATLLCYLTQTNPERQTALPDRPVSNLTEMTPRRPLIRGETRLLVQPTMRNIERYRDRVQKGIS